MSLDKNYQGTDVNLETSLEEYGFVARPITVDYADEYFVIYKMDDNQYGSGHIRESELDAIVKGTEWASEEDVNSMLETVGASKEEWMNLPFTSKFSDLVSYWGTENIMGTDYYPNDKNWAFEEIGLESDSDDLDDLVDYVVPSHYAYALVNGDYSGLSDEEEQELNEFTETVIERTGNANFIISDNDEGEYFTPANDINNLGSTVRKVYIRPSNEYKRGGFIYEVQKKGSPSNDMRETMFTAKNLTDLKKKIIEKYGTSKGFIVSRRAEQGYYVPVKFEDGGMFEEPIGIMKPVRGKVVGSVPVSEDLLSSEVKDFINYVYEAYKEDGFTKEQVKKAVNKYLKELDKEYTYGGGDSLDRERVYQFLLNPNLKEIKNPTFAKGGMVVYLDGKKSETFKTKKSLYEFVRGQVNTNVKKVEIDYGNRIIPTFDTYIIENGKLIHKGELIQPNIDKEEVERKRLESERNINRMMGYADGGEAGKQFIIQDWAGNHLFRDKVFDSFEDGWEFIYENVKEETEDDGTYDDYYVIELENEEYAKGGGVGKSGFAIMQKGSLRTDAYKRVEFFDTIEKALFKMSHVPNFKSLTKEEKLKLIVPYTNKGKEFSNGGGVDDVSYEKIYEVLKDKIEESTDDLGRTYENSSDFTGEEIEHKFRDGFIPYTNGGYELSWYEYVSTLNSTGYTLPTEKLQAEMQRHVDYAYELAKDTFKETYPEIVEVVGEDNIDYNSLDEAGFTDEAQELSDWEMENMSNEDTIRCSIIAYYYEPTNEKGQDGKHTISLQGDINLEAPYHRKGKNDDFTEVIFTFDSMEELNSKMDDGLKQVIDWFNGSKPTGSDDNTFARGGKAKPKAPKIVRTQFEEGEYEYADGGEIKGVGKFGLDKIIKESKENPTQLYLVTDDNYSNIGHFYLKNGKFAKRTVDNENYDFENSKVTLKPKSDVIYKSIKLIRKLADGGGVEINSVSELYDWEEASNYPYARDMVAYFIFGDRDDNIINKAIKGVYSKESADESKLSEIMLGYEYNWMENMEQLDVETVEALGDLVDYYANGGGVDDFKMSYDEMTTYEKSNHIHYNPMNSRWEVTKNGENKEFWNQEQAEKYAGFEFDYEKDSRYSRKRYEALFGYADGGNVGKLNTLQKRVYESVKNRSSKSITTYNLPNDTKKILEELYYMDLLNRSYIKDTQEAEYTLKFDNGGGVDYYELQDLKNKESVLEKELHQISDNQSDGWRIDLALVRSELESVREEISKLENKYANGGGVDNFSKDEILIINQVLRNYLSDAESKLSYYSNGASRYFNEQVRGSLPAYIESAKKKVSEIEDDIKYFNQHKELPYGYLDTEHQSKLFLTNLNELPKTNNGREIFNNEIYGDKYYEVYEKLYDRLDSYVDNKFDIKYSNGGGVKSNYYIFEGVDNLKGKPLYRVESSSESDNEYVGEWHTNKKDAQKELDGLSNNSLGVVKVIFENPEYNYTTNVGAKITESEARKYFVGKMFDVGVYPKENMQKAIDIEFSKSKDSYADGGGVDGELIIAGVKHKLEEDKSLSFSNLKQKGAKELEFSHPFGYVLVLGNKGYIANGYKIYSFDKKYLPKLKKASYTGNYADGGGVDDADWIEESLIDLQNETGFDDLVVSGVNPPNHYLVSNDNDIMFQVFKTEDDAREYAIEDVKEGLELVPEEFNKEWLMNFAGEEDFFKPFFEGRNENYVNDIENEDSNEYPNRLIEEMVDNGIVSSEEAKEDGFNAEDYKEDLVNLLTKNQIEEGNGGLKHYIDNFGIEDAFQVIVENQLIDINQASKNAVDTDGIAHFLSAYDGEQIDLLNGHVAYRTN